MKYTPTGGPRSMHKLPQVSILCYFYFIIIFFFSYYEPFKEFVREIQYNLCTELEPPVIQPILYSSIVSNKGCRVLDLVHTPHNIFIDPPPSLLPPPPLVVEQLCSGLIVLTVARNTYFMEACFDIYVKYSDPDKQVML